MHDLRRRAPVAAGLCYDSLRVNAAHRKACDPRQRHRSPPAIWPTHLRVNVAGRSPTVPGSSRRLDRDERVPIIPEMATRVRPCAVLQPRELCRRDVDDGNGRRACSFPEQLACGSRRLRTPSRGRVASSLARSISTMSLALLRRRAPRLEALWALRHVAGLTLHAVPQWSPLPACRFPLPRHSSHPLLGTFSQDEVPRNSQLSRIDFHHRIIHHAGRIVLGARGIET